MDVASPSPFVWGYNDAASPGLANNTLVIDLAWQSPLFSLPTSWSVPVTQSFPTV